MKRLLFLSLLVALTASLRAQNLILEVRNIKNQQGSIQLMFYENAESFDQDKPWMIKRYAKDEMKDGCLCIKECLEEGVYGIVLLDDENDSEIAEYNILGLPKEGFGFAGYYHRGIRRPHFEDFKFQIQQDTVHKEIKIRYI